MHASITVHGLTFTHILTATHVDGDDVHGAVVRYELAGGDADAATRGVYVVTVDDVPVFVGSFRIGFVKHWVYPRRRLIYHHQRHAIARALTEGHLVRIYAATEEQLRVQRSSSIVATHACSNCTCIADALIEQCRPAWNTRSAP